MKLRDLLELCRVSNLPTVWSNAAVGVFAGAMITDASLRYALVFMVFAALPISMIYCGGMVLNDYIDRNIDAVERPSRPIPSGRISASNARFMAISLLGLPVLFFAGLESLNQPLGGGFFFTSTITAILLVACVVLYNISHQKTALSIMFMGLCRVGVVVCSASLLAGNGLYTSPSRSIFVYGAALTLFLYTLAISIVARNEMQPRWFGGPKTVMNMIVAMPLVDAVWLIVMGLWPASVFCVACAGMTKLAHRKVAGS